MEREDVLYIPPGAEHEIRNTGEDFLGILFVNVPTGEGLKKLLSVQNKAKEPLISSHRRLNSGPGRCIAECDVAIDPVWLQFGFPTEDEHEFLERPSRTGSSALPHQAATPPIRIHPETMQLSTSERHLGRRPGTAPC